MNVKPAQRRAAQTLVVDFVTSEVAAALADRGLECILLRGPAIARRLYDTAEARHYVDVDLLVPPERLGEAAATLVALGFAPLASDGDLDGHRPVHAREWQRRGVAVDLHRSVAGCTASDGVVWQAFSEHSEPIDVGGAEVRVPDANALALIVALHAAHNGPRMPKPLADLRQALDRLDDATWEGAARLAERVGAMPAFAAGLRMLPEGAARAPRAAATVEVSLRASGAPPLALGLDWLLRTPSVRDKAALVRHVLLPPRGALRTWRPLARHGRAGLIAAYASQPFWLMRHALPSWRAVRRARQGQE